jgi:hypothetical protein
VAKLSGKTACFGLLAHLVARWGHFGKASLLFAWSLLDLPDFAAAICQFPAVSFTGFFRILPIHLANGEGYSAKSPWRNPEKSGTVLAKKTAEDLEKSANGRQAWNPCLNIG